MASAFEDESDIEQVGDGVRYEKGDAVVERRAFEAQIITKRFVEGWANSVAENVDEGPMHGKSGAATEEVFPELLRPRRGFCE